MADDKIEVLHASDTVEGVEAAEMDATLEPFEISLHLPKRPLLPTGSASSGLPDTPSPLKVAVTPQETLNDLRITITDSPEGYWLGAFCFRKPISGAPLTNGAKSQLGERLGEWIELREVFQDVAPDKRELYITHVPCNEADARAHVQRLRDLLSGGAVDPAAIGIDAALSVQDAVRNPQEWQQHSNSKQSKPNGKYKGETVSEQPLPFSDWSGWPSVTAVDLIPEASRRPRQLPTCLRQLALATWNPPPQQWKLRGHLLYLQVGTLEGDVIFVTASTHGFFINRSSGARFDPSPRASGQDYASCSLFDLLCSFSPLFLKSFSQLFNDPISSMDYFSAVPVTNAQPAHPWLVRTHPHQADPLRSQSAYLLTGAVSADTLQGTRDWNDELQSARELPRSTLAERLMRDRVLNRILAEFTQAAARAIPKVAAGEIQAMNPMDKRDAQMFIVNNLFISKGADGVDLYPHMGGDEAAHVAVGKDIQGIKTLNSLDIASLCLLGTVVVDWKGERWVAQSIVPGLFRRREDADEADDADKALENMPAETMTDEALTVPEEPEPKKVGTSARADLSEDTQVIYGGVEGPEVIRDNAAFHKLFSQIAQTLHLPEHIVEDAKGKKHALWLSVDSKGLRGADGRKYVLDLARLNPVDINWLEKDVEGPIIGLDGSEGGSDAKYPHRMILLRPELIEIYWDSEFRKWARAKLAARQEAKKNAETNEALSADNPIAESEEEEPERIDSSEFKLTFNPDAFAEFKVADESEEGSKVIIPVADETDASVAAVRQASEFLRNVAIPRLVTDVAAGLFTAADGGALSRQMHARGINVRYLGYVAQLCEPRQSEKLDQDLIQKAGPGHEGFLRAFRLTVLQEMVLRASKRILRALLRDVEQVDVSTCISHFLNCLLGDKMNAHPEANAPSSTLSEAENAAWTRITPASLKDQIRFEIKKRFRFELPESFFEQELRRLQLLREIALRVGIQLKLQEYNLDGDSTDHETTASEESQSDDNQAQPNGNGQAHAALSSKRNKKKKNSSTEQNGAKKIATTATAVAKKSKTTTFVPEDILNILPIIKDSTPKSTLAEEAFEAGRISISRGDRDLGLDLLMEGVSFHEQVYGLVHPEVARCYALFATIVHHLAGGIAVERAELMNKAKLEGKEDLEADLPPVNEHLSMANAVRYQRQAVTVSERTLGLDHPETLNQYMNLAVLERSAGNTRESLLCLRRVLDLWSLTYGKNHPDCVNALSSIALTLQNARQFDLSLRVYKSAHELALSLFGTDSIHTANLAHELSQAYTLSGDLKTALNVEKEAWRVFEERLGKEDAQTKESEAFCLSLAASAVRVAKMEKEASAREARQGGFGLRNTQRGNASAGPRIAASAPEGVVASSETPVTSQKSLDEMVRYIQGGSNASPASSKLKSKNKASIKGRK